MLFQNKGLGHLLLAALLFAVVFPTLGGYLLYPKIRAHILDSARIDAQHVSRHLSHDVHAEDGRLWVDFTHDSEIVSKVLQDFSMVKMRILDGKGEVIYSTGSQEEVGHRIPLDPAWATLTQERPGGMLVEPASDSIGDAARGRDIVEVYEPIMSRGSVAGAFDLVFDVSDEQRALRHGFIYTFLLPLPVLLLLLGMVFRVLTRLDGELTKRQRDREEIEGQRNALLVEQERERDLLRHVEFAKRQWESTMDKIDDMVIVTSADFHIRRCNKALCLFSGQSFEELLQRRVEDVFPELGVAQANAEGKPFDYRHAASQRWFSVSVYQAELGDAGFRLILTLHDMTDMKRITAELEDKNQEILRNSRQLQGAIDEISALILRVVEEKDFGAYFSNELPTSCHEFMQCDTTDCPCYGKEPMRCWNEQSALCRVSAGDGETEVNPGAKLEKCAQCKYFKEMTANPITMIGEQFNSMMHILKAKNTELKKAYSDLKHTQSHLLQHEKMASIGQLAAGVAHEINNPVGFIASNLSSLHKYGARLHDYCAEETALVAHSGDLELAQHLAESRRKFKIDFILTDIDDLVRESLEGCERVKKIVQDLKGFSRVDQAKEQTVDIHECLNSTINIVWNELKYKAKLTKDFQAEHPVRCLPQQLNQVFMNLLVNAAHAIDKEGVITIATRQDADFTYVSVSDTGCGIPAENLAHIFEPFFTTKEVGKGTGLGLSIVYDIVTKNHHGDILVDSQVGKGTTFTVKIPTGAPA